ncbi:MAG TPA: DUF58 domain-containing protein [Burkholderiales bacterium]|nr:DUF58 domain-containing protein [Burkholderiales bacterium]
MAATLKSRFTDWLFQPRAPESGAILLVQRRVFILPTRHGLMFALLLVTMLLGAINYTLSLGFVLTFLLAALAFNAMLYTFRNLARLSVSAGRTPAVFAGTAAQFTLNLSNAGHYNRYAIGLSREGGARSGDAYVDVPAGATVQTKVNIPSERRGTLRPGRLTLYTQYPLGLYYAWSYVNPDVSCIVYPRPAPAGLALPTAESVTGNGTSRGAGYDDFAGLRAYHAGDPPRHIAWKAAARGQGLLTKQFGGEAAHEVWLSWDQLPPRMALEEKLSCLTRWVLDAHAQNLSYGLRLPGLEHPMSSGEIQRQRCLEALALFELPQATPT